MTTKVVQSVEIMVRIIHANQDNTRVEQSALVVIIILRLVLSVVLWASIIIFVMELKMSHLMLCVKIVQIVLLITIFLKIALDNLNLTNTNVQNVAIVLPEIILKMNVPESHLLIHTSVSAVLQFQVVKTLVAKMLQTHIVQHVLISNGTV